MSLYLDEENARVRGLDVPTVYRSLAGSTVDALVEAVRVALPLVTPSGPDEESIPQTLRLAVAAVLAQRRGHLDEARELLASVHDDLKKLGRG